MAAAVVGVVVGAVVVVVVVVVVVAEKGHMTVQAQAAGLPFPPTW